jgi:hypothetical protein
MDHASHPYVTTGFNIVLYVIMPTLKEIYDASIAQFDSDQAMLSSMTKES